MITKSYILEKNILAIEKLKVALFYGENIGLKSEFKKKIRDINKGSHINFTQDEILNNEISFSRELNNTSLFSENKIIYIENCTDKIVKIIENYLEESTQSKMILFSDNLEKKSKLRNLFEKSEKYICVACYPDNDVTLKNIILSKLKDFQGLDRENINTILNASSNDRYKLLNEIEKIISFFSNKKITHNELRNLLNIEVNENFNLLKDEILNGNKVKSNHLLTTTLLEPEKTIYYLAILNQRLNRLSEISDLKKNLSLTSAVTKMRPPIFWAEKNNFLSQAKIWEKEKINKVLEATYNLEISAKSNSLINNSILLKKLLVDICNEANVV